jgi:sugar phosphate isomerase/epimerase
VELGIFAKTFPQTGAMDVLSAVRDAGYSGTQFNLACAGLSAMPDVIEPEIAEQIAAASGRTGVSIAAISGTYNMVHPDPAVREDGLKRVAFIIEAAHSMGTRVVTLCTGSRDPQDQWRFHPDNASPEAWRILCAELERVVVLAEEHDVDLGIEPELANVVSSPAHARRLLKTIQSERLRIVLDPANLFERETDRKQREIIESAVDLHADRIVMAHAKDRKPDGSFGAAGTGVIDFNHFVDTLSRAGFDGALITHGLSVGEAPVVAAFLRSVLDRRQEA